jgi:hypothetical protein
MFWFETALRLSQTFDPTRPTKGFQSIERANQKFVPHYGGYRDGGWSAIGPVGLDGDSTNVRAGGGKFAETVVLGEAPYLAPIIRQLRCERLRVRLMALALPALEYSSITIGRIRWTLGLRASKFQS